MATGTTPNYSLSYPLSTDPVNVAADVQELAEDLDAFLTSPAFINNLAINAGSLVTSSATAALFNTGATTLNIGGAATTINVGATTGQVNVRGNFNIATGKVYEINDVTVLSATTLGSSVVSSSLTAVGTLTTGTWNAGNILLPLGASSSPSLAFTGDTNTGIWSPAADTVAFSTGGSERIRITSAGGIAIGDTTTSGAKLKIGNGSDNAYILQHGTANFVGMTIRNVQSTTSANSTSYIDTQNENSIADGHLFFVHETDGSSTFIVGTTPAGSKSSDRRAERMRITGAGNVGIGISSPNAGLHIVLSNQFSLGGTFRTSSSQTSLLNMPVFLLENNDPTVGNGAGIRFQVADTGGTLRNTANITCITTAKSATTTSGAIAISTVDNGTSSERMRIDNVGNVTINTTAPSGISAALIAPYQIINIDGGYLGIGAGYWNGSWRNTVSNQGGAAIRNSGGEFQIFTGPNPGTAGSAMSMTQKMAITDTGVINITGSQIVMESGTTGAPTDNVSFKVERGTSPDVEIRWNETGDGWQFTNDGTTYFDIPTSAGSGAGLQDILMFAGM